MDVGGPVWFLLTIRSQVDRLDREPCVRLPFPADLVDGHVKRPPWYKGKT
jgi:hypothetical protein